MRNWLIVLLLPFVGCAGAQKVVVTDPAGVPIADAAVEAVSASMNSSPVTTDAQGEAEMPSIVQETEWVKISKPGYATEQIPVPQKWPAKVVLRRNSE